jgi:hypothetical protein
MYEVEKIDTFNEMRTGGTWNKFRVDKGKRSNESVEERNTERAVSYRSKGGDQNKTWDNHVEGNNRWDPVAEVHASKENIVIMVHVIISESGRQEGSEEGAGVSNKYVQVTLLDLALR